MTTYGFLSDNAFGDVMISSEIITTHFGGLCTYEGIVYDSHRFTSFPNYSGSNNVLDGRIVHEFTYRNPYPQLLFLRPGNYSVGYSIISQSLGSNYTWNILVLQEGATSYPPQIYTFVAPWTLDIPYGGNDNWGMQVFGPDGDVYFDSRLGPLAIDEAGSIRPPAVPCGGGTIPVRSNTAWNANDLDYDFRSTGQYTTNPINNVQDPSNLAFAVPSVTQAVYSRRMSGHKLSRSWHMYASDQHHYSEALWWVMYRNIFGIDVVGNRFVSGWGTFAAGFHFASAWQDGGWMGGGGGSLEYGSQPYSSKTLNLVPSTYLLIDVSRYENYLEWSGTSSSALT
jgi:hypothetical protein